MSTQRTQTPDSVDIAHHRAVALDPLENNIRRQRALEADGVLVPAGQVVFGLAGRET
jgi:hypothetical protein